MKKFVLAIVLITCFSFSVKAQFHLTSLGSVGIGTDDPQEKLHVLGGIKAIEGLHSNSGYFSSNGTLRLISGTNTPAYVDIRSSNSNYGVIIRSSNPDLNSYTSLTTLYNQGFRIGYQNSNDFFIKTNHNVGIGTNDPQEKLHVNGNILSSTGVYMSPLHVQLKSGTNGNISLFPSNDTDGLVLRSSLDPYGSYSSFTTESNLGLKISYLGGNDIYIKANNNIGIGTDNPQEKLHVLGGIKAIEGLHSNSGYFSSNGTLRLISGTNTPAYVDIRSSNSNYGVVIRSSNPDLNSYTSLTTLYNQGFRIGYQNSNDFFIKTNHNVGIGTNNPQEKLHVMGNVLADNVSVPTFFHLKRKNKPFKAGLKEVLRMEPVCYTEKINDKKTDNVYIGIDGQKLQELIPDLIRTFEYPVTDTKGDINSYENHLLLNDTGVKYVLINAIKEQHTLIENLEEQNQKFGEELNEYRAVLSAQHSEIEELKELIKTFYSSKEENQNIEIELSQQERPKLEQNRPNPFEEKTFISFFIPKSSQTAHIQISDMVGNVIRKEKIELRGKGEIELSTKDMIPGQYVYSLITNSKIVASKQMTVQ